MKQSRVRVMARKWRDLRMMEVAYGERRKAQGERLMSAMNRTRLQAVTIGDDNVAIRINSKKPVSKQQLEQFFGKKATERFWKTLKGKSSRYLELSHLVRNPNS